jgi:hypothetical protein
MTELHVKRSVQQARCILFYLDRYQLGSNQIGEFLRMSASVG